MDSNIDLEIEENILPPQMFPREQPSIIDTSGTSDDDQRDNSSKPVLNTRATSSSMLHFGVVLLALVAAAALGFGIFVYMDGKDSLVPTQLQVDLPKNTSLPPESVSDPMVLMHELEEHTSPDDCWVMYYNEVYDMTYYADEHPGGASMITKRCGADDTQSYELFHDKSLLQTIHKYAIGRIVDATGLVPNGPVPTPRTTENPTTAPAVSTSSSRPSVTEAPSSVAPVAATIAPMTVAPATIAPVTVAPVTVAPATIAPVTVAPVTVAPVTFAPATHSPTSTQSGPTTMVPTVVIPPSELPTQLPSAAPCGEVLAACSSNSDCCSESGCFRYNSISAGVCLGTLTPTVFPAPATVAPVTFAPATHSPTSTQSGPTTMVPTVVIPPSELPTQLPSAAPCGEVLAACSSNSDCCSEGGCFRYNSMSAGVCLGTLAPSVFPATRSPSLAPTLAAAVTSVSPAPTMIPPYTMTTSPVLTASPTQTPTWSPTLLPTFYAATAVPVSQPPTQTRPISPAPAVASTPTPTRSPSPLPTFAVATASPTRPVSPAPTAASTPAPAQSPTPLPTFAIATAAPVSPSPAPSALPPLTPRPTTESPTLSPTASLTGNPTKVPPVIPSCSVNLISMDEVAMHNTPDDCWMVLHDQVFDLTDYAPTHPGSSAMITGSAGTDATVMYDMFHVEAILVIVQNSLLGVLEGSSKDPCQ